MIFLTNGGQNPINSCPKEYFYIWQGELTISPEYIENNIVFVFENNDVVTGYYSVVELKENIEVCSMEIYKGFWLEHMFLTPENMGKGIGTKMFNHLRKWCQYKGIDEVGILADPNSKGFYKKMGCEYQKEFPSTIANRTTPLFILKIGEH